MRTQPSPQPGITQVVSDSAAQLRPEAKIFDQRAEIIQLRIRNRFTGVHDRASPQPDHFHTGGKARSSC
ncbi:hypothetical protein GCM10012280_63450 [Wenjunlia tyrosinilytica]|uniref:Uncharacterized protein n=1 Tax=Wenjunlia tyrosinilytica TaxID=1544741 RepID=A0A918E0I8_9ACTN|nr:hypothetical protein GCM10012280_63450 [Wenjunlia tyrosinilytica]